MPRTANNTKLTRSSAVPMAFRSSGLVVCCETACAARSAMMTSPPINRPQRSTLNEARDCGTRPSRVGRRCGVGVGDGGGLVLGDRPPPGVRAIPGIISRNLEAMADQVQQLKERVCPAVERRSAALIEAANWIHAHPEIGHQEVEASKRLSSMLETAGIPVEMGTAGMATAFKAELGGQGAARPRIAILAEYDALPGLGHGCGHNLIGTSAVGAGLALKEIAEVPRSEENPSELHTRFG